MKSDHQTEVLVVGAGPVGMLTALVLGEKGVQTQIIDQESRTAAHSYACALHPQTLKLLDQAGIAGDAIDLGWKINSVAIYEGKSLCAQLPLSDLSLEFPFVLVLPQYKLEQFLEKKLKEMPNVQFHWNRRLQDLQMDQDEVIATVEGLAVSGMGYIAPRLELAVEKEMAVHASFVIGADGQHSIVRQRLGIQPQKTGASELFAVYEIEIGADPGHEMKVVLGHDSVSAMWPLAENRCRWAFQVAPSQPFGDFPRKDRHGFIIGEPPGPNDSLHHLQRLLEERAPWFNGGVRKMHWRTDIQFEHWVAGEFGRGRCWLAGDAAHQTGPVGMQSVNFGLSEGVDLARLLARILRQGAPINSLPAYESNHRAQWRSLLGLTGGLKSLQNAPAWAKDNAARILGCLPASGKELTLLLERLSLELV